MRSEISKRYFLFGWNDNDEWHDESDWELGFMITGLHLHILDRTTDNILRDWSALLYITKGKDLVKDFQHIGVFEIENFREHRDEFFIKTDDLVGLQYCRFKPRTSCIKLVKEVSLDDIKEFRSWLDVFDIMTYNECKDEDVSDMFKNVTSLNRDPMKNFQKCKRLKMLEQEEEFEKTRAQCIVAIIVIAFLWMIIEKLFF